MAAAVETRKADEKLRKIVIVGDVLHQILGSKLPSNKQVLQVFFYNMRFVKLSANINQHWLGKRCFSHSK